MIVAGHETTLDLFTDAVCALLTHPATAERFNITRPTKRRHVRPRPAHLPRRAPGPLQAEVALPALFARFPNLAMAVPVGDLTLIPSIVNN